MPYSVEDSRGYSKHVKRSVGAAGVIEIQMMILMMIWGWSWMKFFGEKEEGRRERHKSWPKRSPLAIPIY